MPQKIKSFAASALVDPVTVNVGRAGAANLDVIQVLLGLSRASWYSNFVGATYAYILCCCVPSSVVSRALNLIDVFSMILLMFIAW